MSFTKIPVKNQLGIQSFFKRVQPDPKSAVAKHSRTPPTAITTTTMEIASSSPATFHTAPSTPTSPVIPRGSLDLPQNEYDSASSSHPVESPPISDLYRPQSYNTRHPAAKPTASTQEFTSSLSPPPSSLDSSVISTLPACNLPPTSLAAPVRPPCPFEKEVEGSDEDDSDSDGSLADLELLLQSHNSSGSRPKTVAVSSTFVPSKSKTRRGAKIHRSPLPVLPKYKFDMKSLIEHAANDDATEISSKRIKAMMAPPPTTSAMGEITNKTTLSKHNEILHSVVGDAEGGVQMVNRAVMRTEATLPEYGWYFFDTESKPKPERSPFPQICISEEWRTDLQDPQLRYHSFVSGFVEDMVCFGKTLPDEIFMWMLDEICLDSDEALRSSYCSVMRQCKTQIGRLLVPSTVNKMFQNLGGVLRAVDLTREIQPVQQILDPYPKRDWAKLHSVVKFLGLISSSMTESTRKHVICMLFRMSVDRVIFENVDLLDLVHEVMFRLCRDVSDSSWDSFCVNVCRALFNTTRESTLRLQMVESISSIGPKTHDLRRRLAMCFCFNDLCYSNKHPHCTMNLKLFITRLEDRSFAARPDTDYRELAALVSLLDIAVDDGRSIDLDLSNPETETAFDSDVDAFASAINNIIKAIGNPNAGFISKIEAKEHLLCVSNRIADTVRSRPRPKKSFMDGHILKETQKEKDLQAQQNGMAKFLSTERRINRIAT